MRRFPVSPPPGRQHGIALIMVLLAFALVTLLAAGMMTSQSLMIYKASHYLAQQQGRGLAHGAEDFAMQILYNDWEQDKKDGKMLDAESEIWGQGAAVIPVEDGVVEVQIDDLQARLNLNSILNRAGQLDPVMQKRFERLFEVLEVTTVNVEKLKDWMDSDEEATGALGAEDGVYLGLNPPYRAANRRFTSVTELRLIAGISQEDYRKLLPYVTALPVQDTALNINTASAPVLRALDPRITEAQAESILQDRKDAPFETVQNFLARPEFAGLGLKNQGLSVNSHFFQVGTRVTFDDQAYRLVSQVFRSDDGKLAVISRDEGQRGVITKKPYKLSQ